MTRTSPTDGLTKDNVELARTRGCLLGGAAGDALGAPVELLSLAEIRQRYGPQGITACAEAYGRLGAITDDTQMTSPPKAWCARTYGSH